MIHALVIKLRSIRFFNQVFHTILYCLEDELKDCESVLDIGCGPSSPIKLFKNIKYSIGVETYKPYIQQAKAQKIHNKYYNKNILDLDFPKDSFDAVILVEVMEHMSKSDGKKILKKAEKWAKKKIILTTPNGFFPMGEIDHNKDQMHISGWTTQEFKQLGYDVKGVTGAKFMYTSENHVHSLSDGQFGFDNMRFKPQNISFLVNAFLQIFVYYIPSAAFELFAVKRLQK
ncbi:MAG: class I SAM-dependent methyltransferase [Candidatus Levyibacteriota bacterium]